MTAHESIRIPLGTQRVPGERGDDLMTLNVYAVDAEGTVHDVAYGLPAEQARAMAKTIPGGIASAEPPALRQQLKELAKDAAASDGD